MATFLRSRAEVTQQLIISRRQHLGLPVIVLTVSTSEMPAFGQPTSDQPWMAGEDVMNLSLSLSPGRCGLTM